MPRISHHIIILLFFLCAATVAPAQVSHIVVADSATRLPLSGVSVFSRSGKALGVSNHDGTLPFIDPARRPATLRRLGFAEAVISPGFTSDTVFLRESITELPEIIVESRQQKVLHMLAYVREYSTLTTYSDTVFLFREKMVDYMLPGPGKSKLRGWRRPRVLSSRSYYRFTDAFGIDSVSDKCNHHFSWSDWAAIPPESCLPSRLRRGCPSDTVMGRYSPAEIWSRRGDRLLLDVDVLADTTGRKWAPGLRSFFRDDIDFELFRIRFNYADVTDDSIRPLDLTGYSFNIESNGRGRGMFKFNRRDEPFFVSTYSEVYFIDKEYITVKEARRWEKLKIDHDNLRIYEAPDAPPLQPEILALVDRVTNMDTDLVQRSLAPDRRLAGRQVTRLNPGQQILKRIKGLFGIDHLVARHKWNNQWKEFRDDRRTRNADK